MAAGIEEQHALDGTDRARAALVQAGALRLARGRGEGQSRPRRAHSFGHAEEEEEEEAEEEEAEAEGGHPEHTYTVFFTKYRFCTVLYSTGYGRYRAGSG